MPDALGGTLETILVVDDNEAVVSVVAAMLSAANFRVFSAHSGGGAIKLAKETKARIDLLLSDVDMPIMSGTDLGELLKKTRPDILVMLMSGGNNSGNLLMLKYGWAYIQKPFLTVKLVQMVTEVLHSKDRSQLGCREFASPGEYS